jgi:hypothetical protein
VAEENTIPKGAALPMLMSLILPGAGEAYLGYFRGYPMMALDIALWIGVKHFHDKGHEKRDEYYAFAEEHWSEEQLSAAFYSLAGELDPRYEEIAGVGREYFQLDGSDTPTTYKKLPLWVSREDDEREYFENLGKWDQFVFGWDDFQNPHDLYPNLPQGQLENLTLPGVSNNREIYRAMRRDSNDQFTKRDRLLYLNIAARVFSVFQVAYLQGLFGGGQQTEFRIAGHPVGIIAEPRGMTSTRLGLSVAY